MLAVMPRQPITEAFGFPVTNTSDEAERYRIQRLCPFNNKVPNCTKDKALDPLGVCSVYEGGGTAIENGPLYTACRARV